MTAAEVAALSDADINRKVAELCGWQLVTSVCYRRGEEVMHADKLPPYATSFDVAIDAVRHWCDGYRLTRMVYVETHLANLHFENDSPDYAPIATEFVSFICSGGTPRDLCAALILAAGEK